MNSYVVKYRRIENGWWLATVDGVRGCLTQGRTINQTRERIREALSLFVDDAESTNLIDKIQLSTKVQRSLNNYKALRERTNKEIAKLQDYTSSTAKLLIEGMHISMRDAGELLRNYRISAFIQDST